MFSFLITINPSGEEAEISKDKMLDKILFTLLIVLSVNSAYKHYAYRKHT